MTDADGLADGIADRSASGIAAALHRLINRGALAPGDRLPTVRDLAAALGTSPATVAEAWRGLAAAGAIVARGRAGTFVSDQARWASRFARMTAGGSASAAGTELSTGVPDPTLLPDLGPALARVAHRAAASSYVDEPVLPDLAAWLRSSWPYDVPALTVVDGAMDGIDRVLRSVVRLGDHVAVEHPAFPPFLDMLEALGAVVVPVDIDADGPRPRSLAGALAHDPVAFVFQPRAQNPTGASLTPARARALARVLRGSSAVIVEDNHSGSIAQADDISLGAWLPDRTVHVRSYSKSHGPDLRIAALGGPAALVAELQAVRQLGPGWTSRLLQGVLLDMLTDPVTVAAVAKARDTYAARRAALTAALASHRVKVPPGDGLAMWIPVADERRAVVTLAAAGIGVSPGTPFYARASSRAHIRITLGNLPDDAPSVAEVARLLALAAGR